MRKTIILILMYLATADLSAQAPKKLNLSEVDLSAIKEKALEIIGDFDDYISRIASDSPENATDKELLISRSLSYFLTDATVEVSNKNTKKITEYPIEKYLTDVVLKYRHRYSIVQFEALPFKTVELSPIYENGIVVAYEGIVKYRQIFRASISNNLQRSGELPSIKRYDYFDTTTKSAKVYVRKVETPRGDVVWIVKLGDIKVIKTTD